MAQNKIPTPADVIAQIRGLSDEDLDVLARALAPVPNENITDWTNSEVTRRAEIRLERGEFGQFHGDWYDPRPLPCTHPNTNTRNSWWECDNCGDNFSPEERLDLPAEHPGHITYDQYEPAGDVAGFEGGFAYDH